MEYDEYAVNNAVYDLVEKIMGASLMIALFLMLIICVPLIIGLWKIFEKAGE